MGPASGLDADRVSPGPTLPSRLSINTATAEELALLKGIGPKLAQAIVDYRTEHGPFGTTRGLLVVRGIGEKTLTGIEGSITTSTAETQR